MGGLRAISRGENEEDSSSHSAKDGNAPAGSVAERIEHGNEVRYLWLEYGNLSNRYSRDLGHERQASCIHEEIAEVSVDRYQEVTVSLGTTVCQSSIRWATVILVVVSVREASDGCGSKRGEKGVPDGGPIERERRRCEEGPELSCVHLL